MQAVIQIKVILHITLCHQKHVGAEMTVWRMKDSIQQQHHRLFLGLFLVFIILKVVHLCWIDIYLGVQQQITILCKDNIIIADFFVFFVFICCVYFSWHTGLVNNNNFNNIINNNNNNNNNNKLIYKQNN